MTATLVPTPTGATRRAPRRRRRRITPSGVVAAIVMAVLVVSTLYPMLWLLFGSLKSSGEFYTNTWGLPADWTWTNFADAWQLADLGARFLNTLIVTAGTLVILVPVASMAGYVLAKFSFRGRAPIYYGLLFGITIPFGVLAVPTMITTIQFHLFNSLLGLILVSVAQAVPFGVFLMETFFSSIPDDIEEAARLDGCSRFGAFARVILPLAVPGVATLAIFTGLGTWNDYLMASVLLRSEGIQTLAQGLVVFTAKHTTDYPTLFAALVTVTAPIVLLYLVAQKQFIRGMTAGAIR
ncbi:MAG: carbohydrate ABC transporter permease [Microbacteriaceae bacterium]